MALVVQASIDVRWLETVLAFLVIASADASSTEVNVIPLKIDGYAFLAEIAHTLHEYGRFSARKIAADTQVIGLEKAPAAN